MNIVPHQMILSFPSHIDGLCREDTSKGLWVKEFHKKKITYKVRHKAFIYFSVVRKIGLKMGGDTIDHLKNIAYLYNFVRSINCIQNSKNK